MQAEQGKESRQMQLSVMPATEEKIEFDSTGSSKKGVRTRRKKDIKKAIIKKGRYSLLIIPAPALGRDDHKTASGTASEDEEGRESASVSLVGWLAGWLVGWLVWLVGSFSISRRCLSSNPECENQMPGTCVSVYACVRAVCEKPSPTKSQPRAIQS
jgi:hypothetical protein